MAEKNFGKSSSESEAEKSVSMDSSNKETAKEHSAIDLKENNNEKQFLNNLKNATPERQIELLNQQVQEIIEAHERVRRNFKGKVENAKAIENSQFAKLKEDYEKAVLSLEQSNARIAWFKRENNALQKELQMYKERFNNFRDPQQNTETTNLPEGNENIKRLERINKNLEQKTRNLQCSLKSADVKNNELFLENGALNLHIKILQEKNEKLEEEVSKSSLMLQANEEKMMQCAQELEKLCSVLSVARREKSALERSLSLTIDSFEEFKTFHILILSKRDQEIDSLRKIIADSHLKFEKKNELSSSLKPIANELKGQKAISLQLEKADNTTKSSSMGAEMNAEEQATKHCLEQEKKYGRNHNNENRMRGSSKYVCSLFEQFQKCETKDSDLEDKENIAANLNALRVPSKPQPTLNKSNLNYNPILSSLAPPAINNPGAERSEHTSTSP